MSRLSASKTGLALQCGYWLRPEVPHDDGPPGPAAERGTALHGYVEAALQGKAPKVAPEHAEDWHVLDGWVRDLKTRAPCVWPEVAYALHLETGKARELSGKKSRDYSALAPGELAGTADVVYRNGLLTVIDLKTGDPDNVEAVETNAQLRTLGLMAASHYGVSEVRVGLAFLVNGAIVEVFADLDELDLDAHRVAIGAALARVDAQPTPGKECKYCPARFGCPAVQTAITAIQATDLSVATAADVARVWPLLKPIADAVDRVKERARELVEERGELPLLDGKRLRLVPVKGGESVSMAGVRKAGGEALVERLREAGAVSTRAGYLKLTETK